MERLKQYLADEKISQTELARRVNVAQPTVWEWLRGGTFPSAKNLKVLAEVTGLTIDELLGPPVRRTRRASPALNA